MWNSKSSFRNPYTPSSKDSFLSSSYILYTCLILTVVITFLTYFNQAPDIHIIFIGFSIILLLFLAYQNRKLGGWLKRLNALLEHSSNPVQVLDGNGIVQYANPAFLEWSGICEHSIIGQKFYERLSVLPPAGEMENVWSSAQEVLLSGKVWMGEVEFARADGKIALAELILSPVLDANGKLWECVALHNDLAEQKEFSRKMTETQMQYRSIVESSLDGIIVVQDERLVYVNPSAIHIFGYASMEEMFSLAFSETVAPSSKPFISMTTDGRALGEEVLRNYELRGLTKQGKIIDLEVNAHIISWNDHPAVQASFRNITERKMLEREQALWLWEQETLSSIDRKLIGVVDLQKILTAILQYTLNLTRSHFAGVLVLDELTGLVQWKSMCGNTLQHGTELFSPNKTLHEILKTDTPLIIQNSSSNAQFPFSELALLEEEKLVTVAWLPLMVEGRHKGMLVVGYRHVHEFTAREMRLLISLAEKHAIAMVNAQLYTDLLQREKELEFLSGARVQAQEDERRRIAREIHDGLGQMLTAIKFNLEILEDMISAGQEERERIDDMKNLLDSVMKEAREISYNLMPSVLDDFGLAPALQLLGEQFANRTNVKVQFQSFGLTDRLESNLEIGLYRIAQESLNNISKHAEATEVNIQIINHNNGLRLVVEDNGKGIMTQPGLIRATDKGGMGLPSMRERASSFGGVLTIDSTPNYGTLITVEVPLNTAEHHE
ncbi:MAG: PAS domain S-box protein [Ignavibacteriae bacterium]|nr:MAG: PAS domain S-box protein [Ignavibacteriota bacterium]